MPHVVINRAFKNQLQNGVGFTLNPSKSTTFLLGIIGERIQATHRLELFWNVNSSVNDVWPLTNSGSSDTLTRQGADWDTFGFSLGDEIEFFDEGTQLPLLPTSQATILAMTGTTMVITTINRATYPAEFDNATMHGITPLTGVEFRYGLIENAEADNFNSKIDTQEQYYYADDVGFDTGGGVRSLTPVTMTAGGAIKGWQNGSVTAAFIETSANGYVQTFEFIHEFLLLPYYLDGQDANLDNTLNQPPLFQLNESIKYICEGVFHDASTNPNNAKPALINDLLGDVGYYDERFNSFLPVYSLTSIDFEDEATGNPVAGIQLGSKTTVTIVVASDNATFSTDDRFTANISYAPPATDYLAQSTDYEANFLYDNVVNLVGAAQISGSIITNVTAVLDSTVQITIEFDVDFTISQQTQIDPTRKIIVWVMVNDESLNATSSDRMALLGSADVAVFDADVEGLMFLSDKYGYWDHLTAISGTFYSDIKGVVEDEFLLNAEFHFETALNASLISMKFRFVAWNTTTDDIFDIDTYDFDLSGTLDVVASGGDPAHQQFTLSGSRGFQYGPTDGLNFVRAVNVGFAGTLSKVRFNLGFKVRFEDWIALPAANNLFYVGSEPHFGMNQNASIYNSANGYGLYIFIDCVVSDGNSLTLYRVQAPQLDILNYDDDGAGGTLWTAVIQTFNQSGFNLQGAISTTENTVVIVTHTYVPLGAPPLTDDFQWVAIDVDQGGQYSISRISTTRQLDPNSPMVPLPSETQLKQTIVSNTVVLECEIDHTKIIAGTTYYLSSRLETQ